MKTKETKKMYYAAYGLLMNENYVLHCRDTAYVGTGEIMGYKLIARGYLTIVPQARKKVPVVLYEINEKALESLDSFENYPKLYTRDIVKVKTANGTVKAIAYKMKSERYEKGFYNVEQVVTQYVYHGLDTNYLVETLSESNKGLIDGFVDEAKRSIGS